MNLQNFVYNNNQVRTIIKNNEPWFVAKDVCDILEIKNATVAVSRLDQDEVTKFNLGGLSGESNIVNEFGLYNLILASRKPEARKFKRWVTHDVLPSIRKTGSYNSKIPQTFAQALRLAADQSEQIERQKTIINKQTETIKRNQVELSFLNDVFRCNDWITINQVAKSLNLGTGEKRLFKFLRENGILRSNNEPYQRFIDAGYFKTKLKNVNRPKYHKAYTQTVVSMKGAEYIYRKMFNQIQIERR